MSEDRFCDIEIKVAHLEAQVSELSDVIHEQWKELERYKRKLVRAESKIEGLESSKSDSDDRSGLNSIELAALDRPPHY